MPVVQFLPSGSKVEVPEGTLIHEAAIQAGVTDLHLPCGGKGTCGQCLVEVVEGPAGGTDRSHLGQALSGKGLVMACRTKVRGDMVIRIRPAHESAMRVLGDSHFLISEDLIPAPEELSPVYRALHLTVPPASIEEHYSDWQRLLREIGKLYPSWPVRTHHKVLRFLAENVRAEEGKVTAWVQETDGTLWLDHIRSGHHPNTAYGLAIDIGTTTVVVQLVDLESGRVLASRSALNAQVRRGADVISRIDYARNGERLSELRSLVLDTVNSLVREVTTGVPVALPDGVPAEIRRHFATNAPFVTRQCLIQAAFVAGNTTMIHLLLGLPPQHIRETPYVPTVTQVPGLTAEEVGLEINPAAPVAFAPGVGSYVGGDITAGVLCTELPRNHDEVFLFMDIGTNGEIVLGNADWMVTCACSAGPAFEGSGIHCGMRAMEGAIEYVEIEDGGSDVRTDVIGGGKPAGICGSGLISLLGELFVRGIIDPSGHFLDLPTRRLVRRDNTRAFVLEWGANTADGHDLVITEADIENLMRTKAAIYAACALILGNVGFEWSGVARIFIAGGFGRYIQVEDAVLIGLLPDLPRERFSYIGNSALTGANLCLLSRERREELAAVASRMTYIDLSSEPRYMDQYVGALFLPHTDITRFPSVSERLKT